MFIYFLLLKHDDTTREMRKLYNYISTKAKPHIFYRPKTMNSAAETKLKESKKFVDRKLDFKSTTLLSQSCEINTNIL